LDRSDLFAAAVIQKLDPRGELVGEAQNLDIPRQAAANGNEPGQRRGRLLWSSSTFGIFPELIDS
jgi:hypothetical protein